MKVANLRSGDAEAIEINTSGDQALKIIADSGGNRNSSQTNPPVSSYTVRIENKDSSTDSYSEISGSPITTSESGEKIWSVGNIGEFRTRVTFVNEGSGGGTIEYNVESLNGDEAVAALNRYATIGNVVESFISGSIKTDEVSIGSNAQRTIAYDSEIGELVVIR